MTDDVGGIEEEAAKLLRALREKFAAEVHEADSACCVCPICKAIDTFKELDPNEVAAQATTLFHAVLAALKRDINEAKSSGPHQSDPETQPDSRVQRITIVEDEREFGL